MTVLICPDKFRGSLTAKAAAEAIRRGVARALPDANIIIRPLADGGEGSLQLFAASADLRVHRCRVTGPLRKPIDASYLLGNGRAVIETSLACGLHLVPPIRRHPKNTTTIGVGMLVDDALARGATDILLLLGGSSTNDAGAGMAAALGYRFYGKQGEDFIPMADTLRWVDRIDESKVNPLLSAAKVTVASDVTHPLTGLNGATRTFCLQKGALPEELSELSLNMDHFSHLLSTYAGRELGRLPGGGAAGGLGAGGIAFLGAELRRGIDVIFEEVGFAELVRRADLIVTGEGKVDRQSLNGKLVSGVVAAGKPTIVVCGRSELDAEELGAQVILSLMDQPGLTEEQAHLRAGELITDRLADYLTSRNNRMDHEY